MGWHYVGPTYATGGHGRCWNGYTIQEWHPPTYTATISAEFREELVLLNNKSRPHRAHLVNEFLHDNNIARLEWPACFPDMNSIGLPGIHWKGLFLDEITHQPLREIYAECCWGVGQSVPTGPWWTSGQYAMTNIDMHQCKRMCYWVLEVLVYAATWNTNSET